MTNYSFEKYIYFDLLVLINDYFLPSKELGSNIRVSKSIVNDINQKLANFFHNLDLNSDINIIIENILNLTGIILLLQPFYDGNTRTLKYFLKLFFKQLDYDLITSPYDFTIPLFYSEDDRCNEKYIINLQRRLTKKETTD